MPLSTVFQLYRGHQFYWWTKPEDRRKPPTCHKSLTNYHIMLYTSLWLRFELTTSMVIGTDCIGSCKSNYHTITVAMMAPFDDWTHVVLFVLFIDCNLVMQKIYENIWYVIQTIVFKEDLVSRSTPKSISDILIVLSHYSPWF